MSGHLARTGLNSWDSGLSDYESFALFACIPSATSLRPRVSALDELHETARGLHGAGVISKRRMREFDALRQLDAREMPPRKIKALREKAHLTQAVLPRC